MRELLAFPSSLITHHLSPITYHSSLKRKPMFPRPNPFSRALAAWLLAAVILCPFVRLAEAQDTLTGAFEGTVTDARTGQPVARARVEFVNQQTGVSVTKLTDSRGRVYQ